MSLRPLSSVVAFLGALFRCVVCLRFGPRHSINAVPEKHESRQKNELALLVYSSTPYLTCSSSL
jgi:hypothetical protein